MPHIEAKITNTRNPCASMERHACLSASSKDVVPLHCSMRKGNLFNVFPYCFDLCHSLEY